MAGLLSALLGYSPAATSAPTAAAKVGSSPAVFITSTSVASSSSLASSTTISPSPAHSAVASTTTTEATVVSTSSTVSIYPSPPPIFVVVSPTSSVYNQLPPTINASPTIAIAANDGGGPPNTVMLASIMGGVGGIFLLLFLALAIRFCMLTKSSKRGSPYLGKPGPSVFMTNTPPMSRHHLTPQIVSNQVLPQMTYRAPQQIRSDLSEVSLPRNNSTLQYGVFGTPVQIPPVPQIPQAYMMNPINTNINQPPPVGLLPPSYDASQTIEINPRRQSLKPSQPQADYMSEAGASSSNGGNGAYFLVYTGVVHTRYVATIPDEVSMEPGQAVQIYQLYDDGWCYGKIGSVMGFMPMNFIKLA